MTAVSAGTFHVPIDGSEQSSASNNITAIAAAFTVMNRAFAVDNNKFVTKLGIFSTNALTYSIRIFKRNSAGNYDIVYNQGSCVHPGGAVWVDFGLTTPYFVANDAASYYAGFYTAGAAKPDATVSGEAIGFKSGDITGTGQSGFTENTIGAPVVRVTYVGTG